MLPLMNPNNIFLSSTKVETLPRGRVAHTWWQAGKHPRTLADGSRSWLVVCVLWSCFYFNGCDLRWEKFGLFLWSLFVHYKCWKLLYTIEKQIVFVQWRNKAPLSISNLQQANYVMLVWSNTFYCRHFKSWHERCCVLSSAPEKESAKAQML